LKLTLDHLHKSQDGLESVAPEGLLLKVMIVVARKDSLEIREASFG
jgi:hypothetical protein